MKKIISFLKTDIKIINSYFLFTTILIILVCIGYSSYALFSFTKTSNNVIEGTVGELKKSGTDTLIKLTNNKDNSGLYTITHPKDTTLQIGNNKDIIEYRYRGANPKNYVNFNNETWRIIGIFPTDDGTGKIENRIKLIDSNYSLGYHYWNSKKIESTNSYNNWTGAELKTNVNNYTNKPINNGAQLMVGEAKYYLGGYSSADITKENMYSYERKIKNTKSNEFYYGTNPNSWVGKLAVMYVSDYAYAASDACNQPLRSYFNSVCTSNNWLYSTAKESEWLLNQGSSAQSYAYSIFNNEIRYYTNTGNASDSTVLKYRKVLYLKSDVEIVGGDGTSANPFKLSIKNNDESRANKPILASNMIPVYYDSSSKVWRMADKENKKTDTVFYNYAGYIWANAVTIKYNNSSIKNKYFNSDGTIKIKVGDEILFDDINTMWVWIPRFNAVTPSNYNGGTKEYPWAINVTFVKPSETAIDAFTFGNKQLSGFWFGKFETGHSTLASSTNNNNLGCINETCSNANGIIIKPNVKSLIRNDVSNFFYASRSMEQANNSFGFVSTEVDTHMSKNNEWGAVAYLTQSIYGKCIESNTCFDLYYNNNSNYITGIGEYGNSSSTTSTANSYDTKQGQFSSTTRNIYGIYDMAGGSYEYVMGIYNKTTGSSGFTNTTLPNEKYYNNYTTNAYQGHALYETKGWYTDEASDISSSMPWYVRGGDYNSRNSAGIFAFYRYYGTPAYYSTRVVVTNE